MLRKLPIKIVRRMLMIPFFREEDLPDDKWVEWKIKCAKHMGLKGEFDPKEILATRKRPNSTESEPKPSKESK